MLGTNQTPSIEGKKKYFVEKEYPFNNNNKNEVLNQVLTDMTTKGSAYTSRGYSLQHHENKIVLRYTIKKRIESI